MASLSGSNSYDVRELSPTSSKVLVALSRLGMSPEELEYHLHNKTHDIDHGHYSRETRDIIGAVNQMVEYIYKYGVTEEEGKLYNLDFLVSANPLVDEVIELCAHYDTLHTQKMNHHDGEFNVEEHPPMNTPNKRENPELLNSSRKLRVSTECSRTRRPNKVSLTSPPLSFEDRIAQKRANINEDRSKMISRAEVALQVHTKDMEEKLANQQDRANRRYEAVERLLKKKEETRQSRLLKQHTFIQRRENAKQALEELNMNRTTILQYNLHVKELKRTRFLELREYEREQQKQKALLNSFYAGIVRYRRDELLAKKQEAAELEIEAKQKVFALLDQQAVINACYRGLQARNDFSNVATRQISNIGTTSVSFNGIERELSLGHAAINHNDRISKERLPINKTLHKNGSICNDLAYVEAIKPIQPTF